jgi:uncharacterized membrane protein YbhN (UPF0104 family)
MLKTFFINTFKISLASALIYWLATSGKLDFKLIQELMNYPLAILSAGIISFINFMIASYRWETILRARSQVTLPILGLFKINWIGQFFSSVLPGSVSGDLVKILYLQKFDKSFSKKFIFASILIDRAMGLSGLILIVGFSSMIFGQTIGAQSPAMIPLLNFNYILMFLVLFSFGIFFFFHDFIRKILLKFQLLAMENFLKKIISLWDDLVMIKKHMVKAILLSMIIQFMAVVIFWSLIQPFIGERMNFSQALASIPIGLMTLALPVAPSGLGVGHAIFQKLFEFSSIDNGASLFNIYFIVTLVFNMLGVIPYLLSKSEK